MSKKHILLTGASGGIGSAFFRFAANSYTFRLADRDITPLADITPQDHDICLLDVANLDACQQACQGIHTVIHLAADASPNADFYQSLLHNNIQGTYNIFRAAKDQGCQRVIFASSVQVVAGYPRDVQVHADSALKPMNMYGVSKCFGEAVASYFAHAERLSSIAIRIGSYDVNGDNNNWLRQDPNPFHLSAYISERDLNQLLLRCIEAPDIPFAIVQGISNNRFKRLDITPTRDLLGYTPQDDSFAIFQANLQEWLQG